jgi:hypothetical protein
MVDGEAMFGRSGLNGPLIGGGIGSGIPVGAMGSSGACVVKHGA